MDEQREEMGLEQETSTETVEVVEEATPVEEAEAVETVQTQEAELERLRTELCRQSEELNRNRTELERQWAELERERQTDDLRHRLEEKGMSGGFAEFLMEDTQEETEQKLERFEGLFRESVSQAIQQRLWCGAPPKEPAVQRGYRREELHGLSPAEINAHWDEIVDSLTR